MKKLIALLLAAMMLTALFAGCAKEDANNDQPNQEQTPSAPQEPTQPQEPAKPQEPAQPQEPAKPELTKEEKQTKINEIVTKLMEYENMMPASMPLDATMINDLYQLPEENYDACAVQMPMMMVHATEFAIFWAAEGKLDTVLEKIEARQDALVSTWEHYLPDQYELVQNYKVMVNGDLVVFLVCRDIETISKTVAEVMGEGTEFKTAA